MIGRSLLDFFFFFFVIEGVAGAAGFFIFRARVGVLGVGVGVGVVATVEGADERTSRGTCAGAGVGGGGISPPIAAGLFGSPNFVFLFGGGGSATFSARAEERVLRPLVPSPRALFG